MYELIQVGSNSYYIQCPAKIGVYVRDNGEAFLIDSGNDKDAGKKAKRILDQKGWQLKGILNTHSHADHIGGNRYLQQQTGCKVFVSGIEGAFTQWPELEPSFLYGGWPCKELRHKFLMAQASDVTDLTDPDYPAEVTPIDLPGHCFQMTGFRAPDDTVFLADCLSGASTLEKYGVTFLYDVEAYLETLDYVAELEANCFVPSHADATEDIVPLVRLNQQKVRQIAAHIQMLCAEPKTFEELLQRLFVDYGLVMNFQQYVLIGSTVRSYLAWLRDRGEVTTEFTDNRMLWKQA